MSKTVRKGRGFRPSDTAAIAVEVSKNKKVGKMSATYVTQASCGDCRLRGNGCYAEHGTVRWVTNRLNANPTVDPTEIAQDEADAVDTLSGRRHLRGHVVGDCPTDEAAKIVSAAYERYMAKHGKKAGTYTHQWKNVSRESWGQVSVLASCESLEEVRQATAKGYKTALVVTEYERDTAYEVDGVRIIPCPEMTGRAKSCEECLLCWRGDKVPGTIAFKAHGKGAAQVRDLIQL